MTIENTTESVRQNPMRGLVTAMGDGILGQEAAGAAQVVASSQMPADGDCGRTIAKGERHRVIVLRR